MLGSSSQPLANARCRTVGRASKEPETEGRRRGERRRQTGQKELAGVLHRKLPNRAIKLLAYEATSFRKTRPEQTPSYSLLPPVELPFKEIKVSNVYCFQCREAYVLMEPVIWSVFDAENDRRRRKGFAARISCIRLSLSQSRVLTALNLK